MTFKLEDHPTHYRQLGRSGLKISPICLGTMMFGGPTDETTSPRIIARAREAGINFIDTADAYAKDGSERRVTCIKLITRVTRIKLRSAP